MDRQILRSHPPNRLPNHPPSHLPIRNRLLRSSHHNGAFPFWISSSSCASLISSCSCDPFCSCLSFLTCLLHSTNMALRLAWGPVGTLAWMSVWAPVVRWAARWVLWWAAWSACDSASVRSRNASKHRNSRTHLLLFPLPHKRYQVPPCRVD